MDQLESWLRSLRDPDAQQRIAAVLAIALFLGAALSPIWMRAGTLFVGAAFVGYAALPVLGLSRRPGGEGS